MLDFDPRTLNDRSSNTILLRAQVQQLTAAVPDTCLRLMWGVHPEPPTYVKEVEIERISSLEQRALTLVFRVGMVTADILVGPVDKELVTLIDKLTTQQDSSSLWHDLHIGRLSTDLRQIVMKGN
jgi:hypothetical protein